MCSLANGCLSDSTVVFRSFLSLDHLLGPNEAHNKGTKLCLVEDMCEGGMPHQNMAATTNNLRY